MSALRHRSIITVAVVVLLLLICWGIRAPKGFSGEFTVINRYGKNITIHDWAGMDSWCPARGDFPPGVEAGSSFPDRKEFPESAIVIWSEEGSDARKEQEIDLRGIVPRGVKGVTQFELNKDGEWKVQFLREGLDEQPH